MPTGGANGNLLQVLHSAGDHTAIILPELELKLSYASLRRQILSISDDLFSAGIRSGDRVAMAMPNGLAAIVSLFAASITGTAVPLNPACPYHECLSLLKHVKARVLLSLSKGWEFARKAAADLGIPVFTVQTGDDGTVRLRDRFEVSSAVPSVCDKIALLLHTSGSTGQPQSIPLPHSNLTISAANIVKTYSLSENDVSLCVMPLFHVHGIVASVLATFLSGGTVVVPTGFNPLAVWRLLHRYQITWYSGVPTMHKMLLSRLRQKIDTGSLRFIRSCSAPFSVESVHTMEEMLGVPVVEAYGMTEAAHQVSSNPLPPLTRKAGSVGLAAGIEISIVDGNGNHLQTGERGEVVIQGPTVFSGYENNLEANVKAFVNGWFRTGDQGYIDKECYLHLTGRLKDIIVRGAEKISPIEVDQLLLKHPAVVEAVTFGYAHPKLGEEIAAAVVLHDHSGISELSLLKYCHQHLAEFKCPKKLYIVERIPTTATGKVRRCELAALLSR